MWDEKVLFVNDEYEATPGAPAKGWGEIVAGGVIGAGSALASRLSAFTDKHIHTTHPTHPTPPSDQVISNAAVANARTAGIAEQAEQAAQRFGEAIHEGGQKVGAQLPDSIARPATQPAEGDKSDFRKLAEEGWTQVSIAAKGIASATVTVAGSVSENAHRAVEHNFGRQADKVAQGETERDSLVSGRAHYRHWTDWREYRSDRPRSWDRHQRRRPRCQCWIRYRGREDLSRGEQIERAVIHHPL